MNTQAKTKKRKTQKLGPKQEKWLRMLESGKFKQARYALYTGFGYCCLGVACVSEGLSPDDDNSFQGCSGVPPRRVVRALQLRTESGERKDGNGNLTGANDDGARFSSIAKRVRAEPEQYFKKPA